MGRRFRLPCGRHQRQPENVAKPANDSASAVRRQHANGKTLLNTPFGNEPLPRHFGFQAALGLVAKVSA
jgi:hypothetical protein